MKILSVIFTIMLLSAISPLTAKADIYTEWTTNQGLSKTYIKGSKIKNISNSDTTIMNLSEGKSYSINNKDKTIEVVDLKKMMEQMGGFINGIKHVATGKTKTINGKKCEVYKIEMQGMGALINTTTCELHYSELGVSKKAFDELYKSTSKYVPQVKSMIDYSKGNIAIESVTSSGFGGKAIRSVLSKIEEKDLNSDIFNIPSGYKTVERSQEINDKEDMPNPEQMQKAMKKMQEMMNNLSPEQKAKMQQMLKK